MIVARREAELAATVDELAATGCRAEWVSADLSSHGGVHAAAAAATRPFGDPDDLVNSGDQPARRWAS